MKKYVIGNWKMNLNVHESSLFAAKLAQSLPIKRDVEVVICPSFLSLQPVSLQINHRQMKLGAQDCYWRDEGAFTGEISASQLRGLAQYVIIGHSERRYVFGEDDRDIRFKVQAALRNCIRPILCVGETEMERNDGDAEHVLCDQVASGLMNVSSDQLDQVVIAYEPVWAIGGSEPAKDEDIAMAAKVIRTQIEHMFGKADAAKVPILYGGSSNSENGPQIMAIKNIDGLLLGRASLIAPEFVSLVNAAAEIAKGDK